MCYLCNENKCKIILTQTLPSSSVYVICMCYLYVLFICLFIGNYIRFLLNIRKREKEGEKEKGNSTKKQNVEENKEIITKKV